jgi:hypothetical protein
MRIRLYVQRQVAGVHRHPYEIVDLPDAEAQLLIDTGSAMSLDPPKPPAAPAAPATADEPSAPPAAADEPLEFG